MKTINGLPSSTINDALLPLLTGRFAGLWSDIQNATAYVDRLLVLIGDNPKTWAAETRELDAPTRALLLSFAARVEALGRSMDSLLITGAPWA